MAYTFYEAGAPSRKNTQYYSMLGSRGIWHNGWKAVTTHPTISGWSHFTEDTRELYHTEEDRSEVHNLAATQPTKLLELQAYWWHEAGKYNGLPLEDRTAAEVLGSLRPQPAPRRTRFTYYPETTGVPEGVAANTRNQSYTITADVEIPEGGGEGVLFAQGSRFGGHTLYVKKGRLHYVYNFVGSLEQKISADAEIPAGHCALSAAFSKEGEEPEGHAYGTLTLLINGRNVGEGRIKTQPGKFGLGSGLLVGRDEGEAVTGGLPRRAAVAVYRHAPYRHRGRERSTVPPPREGGGGDDGPRMSGREPVDGDEEEGTTPCGMRPEGSRKPENTVQKCVKSSSRSETTFSSRANQETVPPPSTEKRSVSASHSSSGTCRRTNSFVSGRRRSTSSIR